MSKDIDTLSSVKEAFTHWRTTRLRQGKIPDYLWEQVKGLLGNYTPSKIGSHLGISPIQIRKKLLPVEKTDLQFVEVKGKPTRLNSEFLSNSDAFCSVELHRPCGGILKINAVPMSRVSKLMLDFMG